LPFTASSSRSATWLWTRHQIVPFPSSVPRAVDQLANAALKTYSGYPHGMLTTHADVLNPDLLAFIRS
jgi:non-heme chloroperoxidase